MEPTTDPAAPYRVAYVAGPPTPADSPEAVYAAARQAADRASAAYWAGNQLLQLARRAAPLGTDFTACEAFIVQLRLAHTATTTARRTAYASMQEALAAQRDNALLTPVLRAPGDNRGRPGYITDQEFEAHLARTDERWQ